MPNITSKEMSYANDVYNAPRKCIKSVLDFSKSVRFECLKDGSIVRLDLN